MSKVKDEIISPTASSKIEDPQKVSKSQNASFVFSYDKELMQWLHSNEKRVRSIFCNKKLQNRLNEQYQSYLASKN